MLLKHNKKIKRLAIVLLASGALTACNQVGSDNQSTNASTQSATQNGAQETQKVLQVVNHSGSTIDHMVIVAESGNLIFTSAKGLNCADPHTCNIDLRKLITNKKMLAKFYNSKNQLVSMSSLQSNNYKSKYSTVYANNTVFGAHLFNALFAFEKKHDPKVNAPDLLQKLSNIFQNKTENIGVFAELGAYYSQQLAHGAIHNEDDFYTSLSNAVKHDTPIVLNQTSNAGMPKMLKAPVLMGCDMAAASGVTKALDTLTATTGVLAAAQSGLNSIVGGIFGGISAIVKLGCGTDTFDVAGAFRVVNEKLDALQQSVDTLTQNVQEMKDIMTTQAILNAQSDLDNLFTNDRDTFYNPYQSFLADLADPDHPESSPKSLYDYVQKRGGLDNIDIDSRENYALRNLLDNMTADKTNLDILTSDTRFDAIQNAINGLCSNENTISGDIIAKRNYCNILTASIGAQTAAIIEMARLRTIDKIRTINTKTDAGSSFVNPYGVRWSDAQSKLESGIAVSLDNVNKFYTQAYIAPTKGLDQTLVNSLNAPGNPLHCQESMPSGVNGIVGWYLNNAGIALSNEDKYIVTSCSQSGNDANKNLITNRYYYGVDGGEVNNVLGSLVGSNIDKTSTAFTYSNSTLMKWLSIENGAFTAGTAGIVTTDLPGLVVSEKPYYNYAADISADHSYLPKPVAVKSAFFPSDYGVYEINDRNTDVARTQYFYWHTDYSISRNKAEDFAWEAATGGRRADGYPGKPMYFLRKTSDKTLYFSIWRGWQWEWMYEPNEPHNHRSPSVWKMAVTNALSIPVSDNNNNKWADRWVTFGFNDATKQTWRSGSAQEIGLQCLTNRKCVTKKNDGNSVVSMSLEDGKTLDVWLHWNNGTLELKKNLY